jgi:hypothetical protein
VDRLQTVALSSAAAAFGDRSNRSDRFPGTACQGKWQSGIFALHPGRRVAVAALIARALDDGQTGILGKRGVGVRSPAEVKHRSAIRGPDFEVLTLATQPDALPLPSRGRPSIDHVVLR